MPPIGPILLAKQVNKRLTGPEIADVDTSAELADSLADPTLAGQCLNASLSNTVATAVAEPVDLCLTRDPLSSGMVVGVGRSRLPLIDEGLADGSPPYARLVPARRDHRSTDPDTLLRTRDPALRCQLPWSTGDNNGDPQQTMRSTTRRR